MPLKRALGPLLVSLYGIGTILGAGIYALIGKIVGVAGVYAPLSFLVSALLAILTGFSYTRLVQLFPKSAGEAEYVFQGLGSTKLSLIIGWLVAISGMISAATLLNGFAGYLQVFFPLPLWIGIIIVALFSFSLAMIGIKQSVLFVTFGTIIEVGGLILICSMALPEVANQSDKIIAMFSSFDLSKLTPVLGGAFLAFYAYIGFEDIVNLAEETISPRKTLTTAIFVSIGVSTILYIWVAISSITILDSKSLIESNAPVSDMFSTLGGNPLLISVVSLFAIFNGILAQVIMSSRILYGLRHPIKALKVFSIVSKKTQTPQYATIFVILIVLLLALFIDIRSLAEYTSFTILIVFSFVNLSLIMLELRKDNKLILNLLVPCLAIILNIIFVAFQF